MVFMSVRWIIVDFTALEEVYEHWLREWQLYTFVAADIGQFRSLSRPNSRSARKTKKLRQKDGELLCVCSGPLHGIAWQLSWNVDEGGIGVHQDETLIYCIHVSMSNMLSQKEKARNAAWRVNDSRSGWK